MKTTLLKVACVAAVCGMGFTQNSRAENHQGDTTRIGNANSETGLYAQDDSTRSDRQTDNYSTKDTAQTDSQYNADMHSHGMRVPEVNKASGLIGMKVRNHNNEKLGKIKDVVVDLDTGRVSYLIVSSGGFMGVKSKRLAAPPEAFQIVEGKKEVILDTTKDSVRNAPGLARNDWPDAQNPNWGAESHWYAVGAGAAIGGAAAQAESGAGTSEQTKSSTTHHHKAEQGRETFRGQITSVDPATGLFTVSGDEGTKTFKLGHRPTLVVSGNHNPRLLDFRVGYEVEVGYDEMDGQNTVQYLRRLDGGVGREP